MADTAMSAESTVAHTPGPWVIVSYGDGDTLVIHYRQSQVRICFMATPSSVTDDFPRIKANARLIAAAPELLEALEYTLAALGNPVPLAKRHIARKIQAAIARARGAA